MVACAVLAAGLGGRSREPQRTEVGTAAAAIASTVPEVCRAAITAELAVGTRSGDTPESCAGLRDLAGARAVRHVRPPRAFGIVEEEKASLAGVRLVLSVGHHCPRWPLRRPGESTLAIGAALSAGCRVRRYHGPLALAIVGADGREVAMLDAHTDIDGVVEIQFAELDARLRASGAGSLLANTTLLLGAAGWAGVVDLQGLGAQLAEWHLVWVARGRGLPGLFASLHPEHGEAQAMRVKALEASLKRQESDARRVERGELSARQFLERHAWSPYRSLVGRIAGGEKDRSEGTGP